VTFEGSLQGRVGLGRGIERLQKSLEVLGLQRNCLVRLYNLLGRRQGVCEDEFGDADVGLGRGLVEHLARAPVEADVEASFFDGGGRHGGAPQ
jgi:hypothetical protein